MALDVDKLLADVSADRPCGEDLSYDPAYYAFVQASQGKPPREEMAGQSLDGEEPAWREVRAQGLELLSRSKDLNVALIVASASAALEGVAGLRDGVLLIKGLLERHWDHLHPQLDPDDGLDPLERINLVASLSVAPGPEWNPTNVQRRLRECPLAVSRRLGRFTYRDVLMAAGELPPPRGGSAPDAALVEGAFADSDPDELAAIGAAAEGLVAASRELDQWLTRQVGAERAPDLGPWHGAAEDLASRLRARLASRGLIDGAAAADEPAGESASDAAAVEPAARALSGQVGTREDVVAALGKVLDYYARHEPSSPVPILIRRARRMVPMGFAEAIRELAPAGMDQIRQIAGEDPFEENGG